MANYTPEIIHDFNPNSLPPEFLQAIGLMTAAASHTESVLVELIGGLLGADNIQSVSLSTNMSNHLKDEIIRTLAELDFPSVEELDQLDDLLNAIKSAFEKRNTIVHNSFLIHGTTKEVMSYRLKARGSLQVELKPISVSEVKEHASLMYTVGIDLMAFMVSRGIGTNVREKPLAPVMNRKKRERKKRQAF